MNIKINKKPSEIVMAVAIKTTDNYVIILKGFRREMPKIIDSSGEAGDFTRFTWEELVDFALDKSQVDYLPIFSGDEVTLRF